jgi:alpha-glucosidase (family GH31 glycosyl hydrolase)
MSIPPLPKFDPIADLDAVIEMETVRFSVLTDRLIRLEYSRDGKFEDRPSQAFWYRRQPVPEFKKKVTAGGIEIETRYLRLRYIHDQKGLTPNSLSILLKESGTLWRYGEKQSGNLFGTARTLDGDAGNTKLGPGLLSKTGWVVVDDSTTPVFNDSGWVEPRGRTPGAFNLFRRSAAENKDLYFFGYSQDHAACLADFSRICGSIPMIPRYILGNWWSRYWEYTQEELQNLVQDFESHEIPLSVCIIDMDWHITKTGNRSDGWTGYTWNRTLFPDPAGLIKWLHGKGLRTALNLHPANGVFPHEEQYSAMAQWMGIDPASKKPVAFDIADPHFMEGYFNILHHPYEKLVSDKEGVDFWWMDYQQKRTSKIPGLDPLWLLNHLHYQDLGRDGHKRPFVFSRWGGLGNHRYPIGFSGDTFVSWKTLAYQPFFTATAANVGYGWWSHDIGGHMFKDLTPELYLRWTQFGVFSPIFRFHSTKQAALERRPWKKPERIYQAAKKALQLRHALIPYLYSMAWRAHQSCISLVTPMYYDHMYEEEAYQAKDQYFFGSELMAAPVLEPAQRGTTRVEKKVWFPTGRWTNFFNGQQFEGNQRHTISADLEDIPVFAKAGAVVPLAPLVPWGGLDNPKELEIIIFPGADNEFTLYEDDGVSTDYLNGEFCITKITLKGNRLTIHAAEGKRGLIPCKRTWHIHVRGIEEPTITSQPGMYDPATRTFSFSPVDNSTDQDLTFEIPTSPKEANQC